MKVIVLVASLVTFASCGVIHDDGHHHQATSYQSIQMEHFHAVPTYVKKEDMHYLEHPISEGKTASKVEVHHGSKHEPGYAVANIQSDIHGHHDGHQFIAAGGHSYEHENSHPGVEINKHYEDSSAQVQYEGHSEEQQEHEEPQSQYKYSYEGEGEGQGSDEGGENASYQYQPEESNGSYEHNGREDSNEHY